MTKLIVDFRSFADAHKNSVWFAYFEEHKQKRVLRKLFGGLCICYLISDSETMVREEVDADDPWVLKWGDQRNERENDPAATWRNTCPTLRSLSSNPELRGNAAVTNRLIHGMARIASSDSIKCTSACSHIFIRRLKNIQFPIYFLFF